MTLHRKLHICPECKGEGRVEFLPVTSRADDEFQIKTCEVCKGSGRVYMKVLVAYEPYMPPDPPDLALKIIPFSPEPPTAGEERPQETHTQESAVHQNVLPLF